MGVPISGIKVGKQSGVKRQLPDDQERRDVIAKRCRACGVYEPDIDYEV